MRTDEEVAHHRAIFGPEHSIIEEFTETPLKKREASYTYQMPRDDSPGHLIQFSQPEGDKDYCKYSDYVYSENAGEGLQIYHIEQASMRAFLSVHRCLTPLGNSFA